MLLRNVATFTMVNLMLRRRVFYNQNSKIVARTPGKIHALMSNLTSKQCERKLPLAKSNQNLAEEFATFFQNKIQKIRDKLNDKPHFHH